MLRRTALLSLLGTPLAASIVGLPQTAPQGLLLSWPHPKTWIVAEMDFAPGFVIPERRSLLRVFPHEADETPRVTMTTLDYRAALLRRFKGDVEAVDAVMPFADQAARSTRSWDEWRALPRFGSIPLALLERRKAAFRSAASLFQR